VLKANPTPICLILGNTDFEPQKGRIYDSYKFRILKVLKKKETLHQHEIEKEINIPHSSLIECLQKLKMEKWVNRLEDGRWALFNYKPLEQDIVSVLSDWQNEFKDKSYLRPLYIKELLAKLGKNTKTKSKDRDEVEELAPKCGWPIFQKEFIDHSRDDLRKGLEAWLRQFEPSKEKVRDREKLEEFYSLGSVGFIEKDIRVKEPEESSCDEFRLLKQHLERSQLFNEWEQLKDDIKSFLYNVGDFAGVLLKRLMSDNETSPQNEPQKNLIPEGAAFHIYKRLSSRKYSLSYTYKDIPYCIISLGVEPKIRDVILSMPVENENNLLKHVEKVIKSQIENSENISKIEEVNTKKEHIEVEITTVKYKLLELMKAIDSGYYLKNFCEKCKHYSLN